MRTFSSRPSARRLANLPSSLRCEVPWALSYVPPSQRRRRRQCASLRASITRRRRETRRKSRSRFGSVRPSVGSAATYDSRRSTERAATNPGLSIELLLFSCPAWARLFLPGAGHGTGPGSATRQQLQPLLLRACAREIVRKEEAIPWNLVFFWRNSSPRI
jgi:hypothetical protein